MSPQATCMAHASCTQQHQQQSSQLMLCPLPLQRLAMHAHQSQPVVTRVGQVCYETATVLPPQMNVCCLNVSSAGTMLRVWCCSHVGTCVHAQDALACSVGLTECARCAVLRLLHMLTPCACRGQMNEVSSRAVCIARGPELHSNLAMGICQIACRSGAQAMPEAACLFVLYDALPSHFNACAPSSDNSHPSCDFILDISDAELMYVSSIICCL